MTNPLDRLVAQLRAAATEPCLRTGRRQIPPLAGGLVFRALADEWGIVEESIADLAEELGLWGGREAVAAACAERRREDAARVDRCCRAAERRAELGELVRNRKG